MTIPITPKQTKFLAHVLAFVKAGGRLGVESLRRTPKVAHWAMTTRGGAFTAGVGAGSVVGYKVGRKLHRVASAYVLPPQR